MSDTGGYTFLLHDGVVQSGRIKGGAASVNKLVARIRASMTEEVPPFDTAAAQELYSAIFDDVATEMDSVKTITVAPMGSLLAIPFELLLTGPGDPDKLAAAPWLVRKMPVEHNSPRPPTSRRWVSSRAARTTRAAPGSGSATSAKCRPRRRSAAFHRRSCGDAAALMAHLPPLSGCGQGTYQRPPRARRRRSKYAAWSAVHRRRGRERESLRRARAALRDPRDHGGGPAVRERTGPDHERPRQRARCLRRVPHRVRPRAHQA